MLFATKYAYAVDVRLSMFACLLDIQQHVATYVGIFLQAEQVNSQHAACLLDDMPLRRFVRHAGYNQMLPLAFMYNNLLHYLLFTFSYLSPPCEGGAGGGSLVH